MDLIPNQIDVAYDNRRVVLISILDVRRKWTPELRSMDLTRTPTFEV